MKQIVEYTKSILTEQQLKTGYYGCTAAQLRKLTVAMVEALIKEQDIDADTFEYPKDHLALFVMPECAFEYPNYDMSFGKAPDGRDMYFIDMNEVSLAGLAQDIYETVGYETEENLVVKMPGFCTVDQLSVLFNTLVSTTVAACTENTANEGRLLHPVNGHCFNPANSELMDRLLHPVILATSKQRHAALRYSSNMIVTDSIQFYISSERVTTEIGFISLHTAEKLHSLIRIDNLTGAFKLTKGLKPCLGGFPAHLKYIKKDEEGNCFAKSRHHPCNKKSIETVQLNFF